MSDVLTSKLEDELKWALNTSAYDQLLAHCTHALGPALVLNQSNRFLDTEDWHLRRNGVAIRLRLENESLILTIKERAVPHAQGRFCHHEHEGALNAAIWSMLEDKNLAHSLPIPEHVRSIISGRQLYLKGGFSNKRLTWNVDGEHICLDTTDFEHREDLELEVETENAGYSLKKWANIFDHLSIQPQEQSASKMRRFMELFYPEIKI